MKAIFRHSIKNIPVYLLIALFVYFFFYRLDYNTLASWDEAWYASIARGMMRSGDIWHMKFNTNPYYDHPPAGFWLMAMSYWLFGINEFTTRLPSAVLGLLSIILLYLTGTMMSGKKTVGFAAAVILGTAVWYVLRVRSGNLDATFVFFYILTVYFSLKSGQNVRWFPVTMAAFGSLFMTKTLIGASALPFIVFSNVHHLVKFKKNAKIIGTGIVVLALIVLPWYFLMYKTYPFFIRDHFLTIGTRNKTLMSYFAIDAEKPLFYLHMGIRKWYYLWLISLPVFLFEIGWAAARWVRSRQPFSPASWYKMLLGIWNLAVLYPFLTSDKTELWHLIPVYIPVALIIAWGMYRLAEGGYTIFKNVFKKRAIGIDRLQPVQAGFIMLICIIAALQIRIFYAEVIPANKYTSDDVAICMRAGQYARKVFLDDDYFPLCVYYADKKILPVAYLVHYGYSPELNTLTELFQTDEKDFVVITRNWAVDNLKTAGIPYKVLEKNNSFSIISRE